MIFTYQKFTYPIQVSITCITFAILLNIIFRESQPLISTIFGSMSVLVSGIYVSIHAVLLRITNLDHRMKARDKLLNEIPWNGNETVLDVGCGNGILTMGAAHRLMTGKVIGTDIWTVGSGDNRLDVFVENAKIEGVADRVEIQNQDARQLHYKDSFFDVVISGLTVHHLGFDTEKAIGEMIRVLRPGGWLAIYDEPPTIFFQHEVNAKIWNADRKPGFRYGIWS